MKSLLPFFLAAILALANYSESRAQWILEPGSPNDIVESIAANDSAVIAGLNRGVYVSYDQGATWTKAQLGVSNAGDFRAIVANGSTVLAASGFVGIFRSTDNGHNWQSANKGITNLTVNALYLSGGLALAGTSGGGFCRSTDGGQTWKAANDGLSLDLNTFAVEAFAERNSVLFAGTSSGVFVSNDSGKTWGASGAASALQSLSIKSLLAADNCILAGTAGAGIYRSTDSGVSWTNISVGNGYLNDLVWSMTAADSNIFAGTAGGVFLSTDKGLTWTDVNDGLNYVDTLNVFAVAANSTRLYAGLSGNYTGSIWQRSLSDFSALPYLSSPANGAVEVETSPVFRWSAMPNVSGYELQISTDSAFTSVVYDSSGVAGTEATGPQLAISTEYFWRVRGISGSGNPVSWSNVWKFATEGIVSITSFNPVSGPPGTKVTISGKHFGRDPVNDIVYFGAVRASVVEASFDSIVVRVPVGATYQPISVTDTSTGLSGYSAGPFIVTSGGSHKIDSNTFAKRQDFPSAWNPANIVAADIDGDGRPDLIVTDNLVDSVSVFRNTTKQGQFSLAARADFPTGSFPYGVAVADIDGDGKPDLIAVDNSANSISILRNTSSPGSVSFAPKADFPVGQNPSEVAVGDFNDDGKIDIAVTCWSGNVVSVLRNESTAGTISFAPAENIPTKMSPSGIAIGDIDGDGKVDLVVANSNASSVSIFRNLSTPDSIVFAADTDLSGQANAKAVALGDLDGDGKNDLVVANMGSNSLSVFLNKSTSGSIAFEPPVSLTTGTSPAAVSIGDIDADGKPDIVAVNNSDSTLSVFRNLGEAGDASFAAGVVFQKGGGADNVFLADVHGKGKLDMLTTNGVERTFSVFRNTMTPPPRPSLAAPSNGATGIPVNPTTLKWHSSSTATVYGVQLSTDSTFSLLRCNTSGIADTSCSLNQLPGRRKYFWRVNAGNEYGIGPWSETGFFTTTLAPPVLESPVDDSVGAPTRIELSWKPSNGATGYWLQVSADSTFATTICDTGRLGTISYILINLSFNTTYYWHVRSMRETGVIGDSVLSDWSATRSFTTKTETAVSQEGAVPKDYALYQNFPNPFNPGTAIRFDLKERALVFIDIYNILGQRVYEMQLGQMEAGRYTKRIYFGAFASGVYFFRINAVGKDGVSFVSTKKMVLLK